MPHRQYIAGADVDLEYFCSEGVPTAATVEILDPEDTANSLDAEAVDMLPTATATVTTANSGFDALLEVDDGSSFPLRRPVLAISELGQLDEAWVVARGASSLRFDAPLGFAMGVGATLKDSTVKHTVSDLAEKRGYRAKWVLTVDGETIVRFTTFDVVKMPFRLEIRRADLVGRYPRVSEAIGAAWPRLVASTAQDIYSALAIAGMQPDQLMDRSRLTPAAVELIAHKGMIDRAPGGKWFDERIIKHVWTLYEKAMKDVLGARHLWVDADDDGIRDAESETSLGEADRSYIGRWKS